MTELAGRIALVTGASRGIGAATAVELARLGAHVVLVARTQGGLEATDDAIRAIGGTATLLPLDLRDAAALDTVGPSLFERFRRLDILVSNAAVMGRVTPAPHIDPRDWDEAMAVNVGAPLRLIRSCGPLLLAAAHGRALFLTSRIVLRPTAYFGTYGATKAAHHHLVMSWAEETRRSSLRVNLVDPGAVDTAIRTTAFPGEDRTKLARPENVAPAIAALCLDGETRHGEMIRVSPLPL
ncbi:MAG: SDR family NAD(P)-dependent oxidoreductase [Acetobacteraceae bacterium]|nr:SDR family NAD(P)-dependent oxidoreductase [Acetobacteraceae bacterium]